MWNCPTASDSVLPGWSVLRFHVDLPSNGWPHQGQIGECQYQGHRGSDYFKKKTPFNHILAIFFQRNFWDVAFTCTAVGTQTRFGKHRSKFILFWMITSNRCTCPVCVVICDFVQCFGLTFSILLLVENLKVVFMEGRLKENTWGHPKLDSKLLRILFCLFFN